VEWKISPARRHPRRRGIEKKRKRFPPNSALFLCAARQAAFSVWWISTAFQALARYCAFHYISRTLSLVFKTLKGLCSTTVPHLLVLFSSLCVFSEIAGGIFWLCADSSLSSIQRMALDTDDSDLHRRYKDVALDLNLDKASEDEAWQSFQRIGRNYTLEVSFNAHPITMSFCKPLCTMLYTHYRLFHAQINTVSLYKFACATTDILEAYVLRQSIHTVPF